MANAPVSPTVPSTPGVTLNRNTLVENIKKNPVLFASAVQAVSMKALSDTSFIDSASEQAVRFAFSLNKQQREIPQNGLDAVYKVFAMPKVTDYLWSIVESKYTQDKAESDDE